MFRAILASILLASPALVALATAVAAWDICGQTGICVPDVPDVPPAPPGCGINGYAVRTDCNGNVYVCTARYMGGGSQWLIGNFVWTCTPVSVIVSEP